MKMHLTFPCLCVPSHISPALTLSLASCGEVCVADEVHVHSQAGGGGGAVLEWLEVGGSRRWSLVLWVATTLKEQNQELKKNEGKGKCGENVREVERDI